MGWLQKSSLAAGVLLALSGCGTATSNGLAPQPQNAYPVPSAVSLPQNNLASAPAPAPATPIAAAPTLAAPAVPTAPRVSYSSSALPLTPLSGEVASTASVTQPANQALNSIKTSAHQSLSSAQTAVTQGVASAKSSFSGEWQGDMVKARQESAKCAALSGTAQSACWQGVSTWAKTRATAYRAMSTAATGASSQQMQSAAKFFGVTGEWASACSSLSAQSCAESPLIGQMQQWKASVGIPGTSATSGQ